jgi:hypothetical protein
MEPTGDIGDKPSVDMLSPSHRSPRPLRNNEMERSATALLQKVRDRCEDQGGSQPNRCLLRGTGASSEGSESFGEVRGACDPNLGVYGSQG